MAWRGWKKFPYTNFHELNLDYFLNKFSEIFSEWENLYNTMNQWKEDTDTDLENWKSGVIAELNEKEQNLFEELAEWKNQTESDISEWEDNTESALNAWKTATTLVFEQIRQTAENSAVQAQQSAISANENAELAYQYKQDAETAAQSIRNSANQIETNKNNIIYLNERLLAESERAYNAENNKVNKPLNSPNGENGQILRSLGTGNTEWVNPETPTQEEIQNAVNEWMDENPNDRALIEDGSITEIKLNTLLQNKINGIKYITEFENLVVDGDWTNAVQTAINQNSIIVINRNISINGTVNIPEYKSIIILSAIVIKPITAPNNDPIFYLGRIGASLLGVGSPSKVMSRVDSPNGVIKVGAPSNTENNRTVEFCTVSNIWIEGAANDRDNIGLHLCGTYTHVTTETSSISYVSYFHKVRNLVIHKVAKGILFNNAANANIVNHILFWECGYNHTTGALCFERTQGEYSNSVIPQENIITDIFHHFSHNATTIYMGTGIALNRFDNIICEQGNDQGQESYAIYANFPDSEIGGSFSRNVFKLTSNTSRGTVSTDNFVKANSFETRETYRNTSIYADSLTVNGNSIRGNGKEIYAIESIASLARNTTYEIGSILKYTTATPQKNRGAIIVLYGASYFHAGAPAMAKYTAKKYFVAYNGKTITITLIEGAESDTLNLYFDENGVLKLEVPNYASNASYTFNVKINMEFMGYYRAPEPFTLTDSNFSRTN